MKIPGFTAESSLVTSGTYKLQEPDSAEHRWPSYSSKSGLSCDGRRGT